VTVNGIAHTTAQSTGFAALLTASPVRVDTTVKGTRLLVHNQAVGVWRADRALTFRWAEPVVPRDAVHVGAAPASLARAVVAVRRYERRRGDEESDDGGVEVHGDGSDAG
jgi:hypothetical protein